jgi:hypothetical protein
MTSFAALEVHLFFSGKCSTCLCYLCYVMTLGNMVSKILGRLHHIYHSNRSALIQILEAMIKNDLLDLIGRTILLLKPLNNNSSESTELGN